MKKESITIQFGALCDSLSVQLKKQRLKVGGKTSTKYFSDQHKVIIDAYLFQLVTDKQYFQMRNKFMKKLLPCIKPIKAK